MSEKPKVKKQESELTPEQLEDAAGGQTAFKSGSDTDSADQSGMAIEKIEIAVEKGERVLK